MFAKKQSLSKRASPLTLSEHPDRPLGMYEEARNAFVEIFGSSKVAAQRMFVVALLMGLVALMAVVGLYKIAQKSTVVPILVEVDPKSGAVNKPVRIESVRPNDAVIMAELGRWASKILTIDQVLSPLYFREAVVMTKDLGASQYTDFRVAQKIVERMSQDKTLQRLATVSSVDISQPGVAFIFATTQESRGGSSGSDVARFRLTLKYELSPPRTLNDVMTNPLGLYVTSMNVSEENSQVKR